MEDDPRDYRDLFPELQLLIGTTKSSEQFLRARVNPIPSPLSAIPIGAPGDLLNHRPGFVSLITRQADVRKIKVSQMLNQGMSGGPILDANAGVVEIIHKGGPGGEVS